MLNRSKKKESTDIDYYIGSKNKRLLCHVMDAYTQKEVSKPIKKKIYDQEFEWKKRVYPILHNKIVTDFKGRAHYYVTPNDSSGILSFNTDHEEKCRDCGGKLTTDAKSTRNMVKRKVFNTVWGSDSLPTMLIIVFAIVSMIAISGLLMIAINPAILPQVKEMKEELKKTKELIAVVPPVVAEPYPTNGALSK